MKWRLTGPHHIDEQVLPAGTIIGDGTPWPFRARLDDPKIGRKTGDPLPPSNDMEPLDDEARDLYQEVYGQSGAWPVDPTASIPLTGAENSPRVRPEGAGRPTEYAVPTDADKPGPTLKQVTTPPAQSPTSPAPKEAVKPPGHDSSKNPGDSKDTETAKAPDIRKI
jgi:hypothetical protein